MNETVDATPATARSAFWWVPAALFILVGFVAGELFGAGGWASVKDRRLEVLKVLESQVAAWNRSDLDGFMNVYWKNDQLAFCSNADIEFGWQRVYDRYKTKYFASGKDPGKLSFDESDVMVAGPDGAAVRGRFRLNYANGSSDQGRFTLAMRKINSQWRIVYDHTSSAPAAGSVPAKPE